MTPRPRNLPVPLWRIALAVWKPLTIGRRISRRPFDHTRDA